MNYPLISEYIEAIKSAEDNFEQLKNLRPVLGDDGLPVMTSGNFAVVFKMKNEQDGNFYAVKCFTKEQEGRIAHHHADATVPHIVALLGFSFHVAKIESIFVNSKFLKENLSKSHFFPVLYST